MFTRLSYLMLFVLSLASCEVDEEQDPDTKDSTAVLGIGSASDFPAENQLESVRVFSEDTLNSWGYITTEVAREYHAIRSEKNYGDATEAFYARFHLAKAEFENYSAASTTKERIEALLKSDAGFKDYTQIIQQEGALYSISATSNYTFLSHQPALMEAARNYLINNKQNKAEMATPRKPSD